MAEPAWLTSGSDAAKVPEPSSASPAPSGAPIFKVILVGEVGVGKTALFARSAHPEHAPGTSHTYPTISVDTCTRTICTRYGDVTLTLWDTAGVERYRTLTRNYYRSTHAALLVFSLADPSSLLALPAWQRDVAESASTAIHFLLGNKADLERQVSESAITSFADLHDCQAAFTASARTGDGVESLLRTVGEHLVERYQRQTDMVDTTRLWQQGSGLHVHGQARRDSDRPSTCC